MRNILLQAQQGDRESRERLITDYRPFIIKSACQICKKRIAWEHDEASISLIAFNEAIDRYDENYGKTFEHFAFMNIKNRLIDDFRKKKKYWTSENLVMDTNDEFEVSSAEIATSFETYVQTETAKGLAEELMLYDQKLQQFSIVLEELEESSPSHADTRKMLIQIAKQFVNYPLLMEHLETTKRLPIKHMLKHCQVSRKTLERHRRYLIALIVIFGFEEFGQIRNSVSFVEVGE